MERSSITNPNPPTCNCAICGFPRMTTAHMALCWLCYRLYITVQREVDPNLSMYEKQEVIPE